MQYAGTVRWHSVERGMGFIGRDDGANDIFVPYRELARVPARVLNEGDKVTFSVGRDSRDRPVAAEVELVERAGRVDASHDGAPRRRIYGTRHLTAEGPRVGRMRAWRAEAEKVWRRDVTTLPGELDN